MLSGLWTAAWMELAKASVVEPDPDAQRSILESITACIEVPEPAIWWTGLAHTSVHRGVRGETDFCIDNLLVRIHLIIETILVGRPCATGI